MNTIVKGLMGLVFWLLVGFGLTEATVLSLNAWLLHESQKHQTTYVASQDAEP
jgi:hypothetical protein